MHDPLRRDLTMAKLTRRVGTRLTSSENAGLQRVARSMKIPVAEAIRHAINLYVSQDTDEENDRKREARRVRKIGLR